MARHTDLVEQAMKLADARVDLLRQVTRIHDVRGESKGQKERLRVYPTEVVRVTLYSPETRSRFVDRNVGVAGRCLALESGWVVYRCLLQVPSVHAARGHRKSKLPLSILCWCRMMGSLGHQRG